MSIFDEKNKVESAYFAFKTIGDKLDGTLVGKRNVENTLRPGEEQIVYEIKKSDGEYIDVYGKAGIDMQMRHVKLGQIVGFEFVKQIPPKRAGYKPTNVIQVYASPDVVDEKWIMENEEEINRQDAPAPSTPVEASQSMPAPIEATTPMTSEELLKEINNLAVTKLGATDAEDVKAKVMEKTNLAFVEANLQSILDALKQLTV